jgi:hypothetical protein
MALVSQPHHDTAFSSHKCQCNRPMMGNWKHSVKQLSPFVSLLLPLHAPDTVCSAMQAHPVVPQPLS